MAMLGHGDHFADRHRLGQDSLRRLRGRRYAAEVDEQLPLPLAPSELVDAQAYPATGEFLRRQVDMQFADLRVLFQLPAEDLDPHVGCNLTTAAILLNLISGCSRWFFQTSEAAEITAEEQRTSSLLSRRRFIGFITEYWPKIGPEPSPDLVAGRLYDVRNSLAHDLGVAENPDRNEPMSVGLAKSRWVLDDIVMGLERNEVHPLKVPVIEERPGGYIVHLSGLYWALIKMLRAAVRDHPAEIENAIAAIMVPEIEELPDVTG